VRHDHIIRKIARRDLGIETLQTQHADSLDFHTLAVWQIRRALENAFIAGMIHAETQDPDGIVDALRTIAAIPLWGERISDASVKREYSDAGEYDAQSDEFNPSCDTESTHLRDAVELARHALKDAGVLP
jgi:Family of unknown function (DUF6900)